MGVKNWFSGSKVNPKEILVSMLASYSKRRLEKFYDGVAQTEVIKRVKALDPLALRVLEQGTYALTSFVDQKIAKDSLLRKFISEVATDASPEMMKRLINGAREEIKSQAKTEEELELASLILELEDQSLNQFMTALAELSGEEREQMLQHLRQFTPNQQLRLAQLSPEILRKHNEVFRRTRSVPEPLKTVPKKSVTVKKLTEKIRERRMRLEAKKKKGILW